MRRVDNPEEDIIPPQPNPNPYPYPEPSPTVTNAWGATDSIIGKILHYVTNPWRLLVVIILAVMVWFGLVSYQNIDYIKQMLDKKKSEPQINMSQIDKSVNLLLKNTGANSVLIYKVDPGLNKKEVLRGYDKNGRDRNIEGQSVGLFSTSKKNNEVVTSMMNNEVVCMKEEEPLNTASLWFNEKGDNYFCMISLPPDSYSFIGQITIGFDKEPENIQKVKDILVIVATQLTENIY